MFIQNVGLLCISMIVLGAVLGYITPYIRRKLLGRWLGDGGFDFLPESLRPQSDGLQSSATVRIEESVNHEISSENSTNNLELEKEYSKVASLATERKLELDTYRGDVKQHFVDMAKILNDDHENADALNQAMISQIGSGAEQLVGARSMQGAISGSAISGQAVEQDVHIDSEITEESHYYSSNAVVEHDDINEESQQESLGSLKEEWIPAQADEVDEFFAADKRPVSENRFQEIAEGIEGKSANTFAGVKNWFKGAAGAAAAAMPKVSKPALGKSALGKPALGKSALGNSRTDVDYDERMSLLATQPKQGVYYEDGVLIDDSVLDSKWDINLVDVETLETPPTANLDVRKAVEQPVTVDQDYRSAFVYADSNQDIEKLEKEEIAKPVSNTNVSGDASKYLGLQQGFGGGSSQTPELKNVDKFEDTTLKNTPIAFDDNKNEQPTEVTSIAALENTSDMLDPYDRITDAVLKESTSQNLNDEKKIVHELFYVRGHQSNISGRAMSNINPGIRSIRSIRKDN